ncbi:hypothetical protein ACFRI7_34905 [Streptomyces sp. NPDC056716]|uniref:hypothetical protein n=1 Tax=unclassified Streptomyces TaxID=2593676 RepID=UPI0036768CFB
MRTAPGLCATCGVEFVPSPRRRGRPDSRFCTATCRALWERAHGARGGAGAGGDGSDGGGTGGNGGGGGAGKAEVGDGAGAGAGARAGIGIGAGIGSGTAIGAGAGAGAGADAATPLPPLGTEHSCPHCGHQLTIVNFVLPSLDSTGDAGAGGARAEVPEQSSPERPTA